MPSGIWGRISEAIENRRKKLVPKMKSFPGETVNRNLTDSKENERSFKIGHIQRGIVKNSKQGPILKIEGIFKSFGGVMALKDVNIEMPEGKILGIIGPNGAGKTTLFNVINGYLKPDKGRFFFEGKDITYLKPHLMCRIGIGRTFQVAQIFYRMTVLENIMVGALAKHANIGEAHAISKEVAENLGLGGRANDRAVGLSIWETKMLELSRALATRPKLLLVDEPMAGLNPEETDKIGQIIKDIAMSGMSVIVIEHVIQSLVKISDLMVGLDQGSKVAEGTPDEVTSDPHIIEAYLGAKWKERYAKSQ
jgi:branched-chain amino acid transport system permease protein